MFNRLISKIWIICTELEQLNIGALLHCITLYASFYTLALELHAC